MPFPICQIGFPREKSSPAHLRQIFIPCSPGTPAQQRGRIPGSAPGLGAAVFPNPTPALTGAVRSSPMTHPPPAPPSDIEKQSSLAIAAPRCYTPLMEANQLSLITV